MMNYEIFKEVVAEKFKSYLPERYQNMELRVESVNKVNRVMDGIMRTMKKSRKQRLLSQKTEVSCSLLLRLTMRNALRRWMQTFVPLLKF